MGEQSIQRDRMDYDVIVVGAGPAGLACAIRLKQVQPTLSVCVLEKGATVGAHSLSGCVLDPGPLDELLPDWRKSPPQICVPAKRDEFRLLTATRSLWLPTPPLMANHGNLIVSLSQLVAQLASVAEGLGVDVFPGFAAARPVYDAAGAVAGVEIGDMGVGTDGAPGANYSAGPEVRAPFTVVAEGPRGSITKLLIARYGLDRDACPQTYALGFKELWQLPQGRAEPGLIRHTIGWPLDGRTYGGGFVYHIEGDRAYVGFVVGLNYRDPQLRPFEAFQQFKNHPTVRVLLEGGEPLVYGARTISAGGWQSMPKTEMPGALLIGDAAGVLDVPRVKGVHQAIRCGVLAAEHLATARATDGFDAKWRASPGGRELHAVRNFKPGFKKGLWPGILNGVVEVATAGREPWTWRNIADATALAKLGSYRPPRRRWSETLTLPPRDRAAAVYLAATAHDEGQPAHLRIADPQICIDRCTTEFGNPCLRFCPAAVYELIDDHVGGRRLAINAANCVHCKACDIKDPYGIITWVPPEGGSGPNYASM